MQAVLDNSSFISVHAAVVRSLHARECHGNLVLLMIPLNRGGVIVKHTSLIVLKNKNCVNKLEFILDFL